MERAAPVRRFTSCKRQRHLPGRWWSAIDRRHVGYESWLERDHLAAFDFDPAVVAIALQPFWPAAAPFRQGASQRKDRKTEGDP